MGKQQGGETIIAQGVRVEGTFTAEGDIVIEGEVRGTIVTNGDLKVGTEAKVEADIKAQNAVIAGDVRGNLRVMQRLDLLASSKVSGDVVVETLAVEPGAQVNGTVRMGEEAAKAPTTRGRRGQVVDDGQG